MMSGWALKRFSWCGTDTASSVKRMLYSTCVTEVGLCTLNAVDPHP
jgi:hypothetical protein